jgi:hypothetical protein
MTDRSDHFIHLGSSRKRAIFSSQPVQSANRRSLAPTAGLSPLPRIFDGIPLTTHVAGGGIDLVVRAIGENYMRRPELADAVEKVGFCDGS